MADKISVPKPPPDRVLMVVCGTDGVIAYIALNELLVRESDLAEFLNIMRDAQDRMRKVQADAYSENR